MNGFPPCFGIIPARYESTRFPGKPLADILGKPMFWHVFNRARRCPEMSEVVLATDDRRIRDVAENLNVPFVMTRNDHPSGTDRVLEAARSLKVPDDSIIVNIQGDEPALEPAMLTEMLQPFSDPGINVTTLAREIGQEEAENPDVVKVVIDKKGRALYFSRSIIPYPRDSQNFVYYGHIGLYAFRMKALEMFVGLGTARLEQTEKLEQLRLLENGISIHVSLTRHRSMGVDRPEDIKKIIKILSAHQHSDNS